MGGATGAVKEEEETVNNILIQACQQFHKINYCQ